MTTRKLEHLNARLQQKLGAILEREANDPRFRHVTVTSVNLSKDLSYAKVTFSTYDSLMPGKAQPKPQSKGAAKKGKKAKGGGAGDIASLTQALNKAAGFFSVAIARTLETRITPKLNFVYDPTFDFAQDMENVLKPLRAAGEMGDPQRKTGEIEPPGAEETP
jgi:ribosome-binding factor A